MPPKFHTAVGYNLFSEILDRTVVFFEKKSFSFLGYGKSAVVRRVMQRFTEVGLSPFIAKASIHYKQNPDSSIFDEEKIDFADFTFHSSNNTLNIGFKLFLRSFGEFLIHWWMVLFTHLSTPFTRRERMISPVTIVFGVGSESFSGDDGKFLRFCREGPITPLRSSQHIIVMSVNNVTSNEPAYAEYARFPLLALHRCWNMTIVDFFMFFLRHVWLGFVYLYAVLRFPMLALLGKDFAYHEMVLRLNREGAIRDMIITNSNYSSQPMWMSDLPNKQFSTHMIFYSMNIVPFVYKHDQVEAFLPNYRFLKVDALWVWTEYYSHYLKSIGVLGTMHIVGPILWYLPEVLQNVKKRKRDAINIALFDVTPYQQAMEAKLGMVYNYYSASNVEKFLDDICRMSEYIKSLYGKEVVITLKHKREYHPMHDQGYIDFVEGLERGKRVRLADPGQNLYEMIANSDITIVLPYSSPFHVAVSMGKRAILYDPSEELIPAYEKNGLVSFAAGREALLVSINEALSESQ